MDLRPVIHVLGLLLIPLGLAMLPSAVLDAIGGGQSWAVFGLCGFVTIFVGGLVALVTRDTSIGALTVRQAFLLTTSVWAVLPLAGAIPFMLGVPNATLTDAYFEAVSGVTTTGSTVFVGLDDMPAGTLLWRGILQWLGGLGIVIVALIFLPVMRVGGMQFFRSEGFDTLGKVLPRALDISRALMGIYIGLTVVCAFTYAAFGMTAFEAVVHALTTLSTGGFSTSDASFAIFRGPLEYVSVTFMILASVPFIRFVQVMSGQPGKLFSDVQVQAYLRWIAYAVGAVIIYRLLREEGTLRDTVRETLFNVVTLFSGTGYGSEDVSLWGPFSFTVIILVGLIGGCTASTGCSIKIFRWLVMREVIRTQLRRTFHAHGVFQPKLGRQTIPQDVIDSVVVFMTLFLLGFGILSVGLAFTGLEFLTAVTAAWTAIANVGPAWGPEVGPTGAMNAFPTLAKWMMIAGMLIGRLEILSVLVLFVPMFWRA